MENVDSPKHGPTLSTSTSSFDALDPHDPNLSRIATKMFDNISQFIQTEFGSLEDYKLLESMNDVTWSKYQDIQQIMTCLQASTTEMNSKLAHLEPLLQQIDEINETVNKLESAALKLDAYSIELEKKLVNVIQPK